MLEDDYKHKGMRRILVKAVRQKGIKDEWVLDALARVPRHFFFETALLSHAYEDKAFPIGENQTISQPYTVARQTELLALKPTDRVLEVGTGSGYQCAILLEMGLKVYSIERIPKLSKKAGEILREMGYKDINLFVGDGSKGYPIYAPFDKILVTAAAPFVPPVLVEQLAPHGKLVIPVGSTNTQRMMVVSKTHDRKLVTEMHESFSFVPLVSK